MEAETRRKVEDMVLDILQKSDIQETTEFTIRVAASERLGIDLSGPETKRFVRTIIETYLLSIATAQKSPPQLSTEVPVTPNEPPQVSNEPVNVTAPKEPPQELNKVAGVKRKNDDSDKVICQLSSRRNVAVRDFKGMTLVSIREFYNKDGKQLPTSKGISLSSEQWSTFKNCVPAIEEAVTKLEGRIRSGINGKKNGEVASSVIDVPVEPVAIEPVAIDPVPIEIVRFDGKNYQVWAEQMELFLKQLKINYVLTEPCPNATLGEKVASAGETKAAEKRWVNDDLTCRRNILSHLSDNLFNKYTNTKMTARDLWEDLKFVYLYEEYGTKISQVKKYIEFQMVDEKAVLDQIQELNCIADSIAAVGMPIEENFHVSVIVSKLPLSRKDLSIKLMREEHLPFWKLMECITKEEESRNGVKQMGELPSDSARFHRANEGGSSGAEIKPPPGFQRKYEPNSKNASCYICGQKGHFSKNCWRWL
ncbi:transcriptional coactivator p15 (PC4) family protein (KELP) [Trifolium repens]|nr:transcriptional coactivator p15 (PC4) family protein (KELP) [Trifolium repens]